MRLFIKIIILVFFTTTDLMGQVDHLTPVGGIFDIYDYQFEYYSKIRTILFDGLTDSPTIRFLVKPSFSPESVLDIQQNKDTKKYLITYHICNKMIWYNENLDKIKVKKFTKEISEESVELIKSLFLKFILQTRYTTEPCIGLDGTTYVFSVNDWGMKSGTTWSPPANSKMRQLVDIGQELIALATNNEKLIIIDGQLKNKIDRLKSADK